MYAFSSSVRSVTLSLASVMASGFYAGRTARWSAGPKISLEQFLAGMPVTLGAFERAYRREAETDATFPLERDEQDWHRELSAYSEYVEVEEESRR